MRFDMQRCDGDLPASPGKALPRASRPLAETPETRRPTARRRLRPCEPPGFVWAPPLLRPADLHGHRAVHILALRTEGGHSRAAKLGWHATLRLHLPDPRDHVSPFNDLPRFALPRFCHDTLCPGGVDTSERTTVVTGSMLHMLVSPVRFFCDCLCTNLRMHA